MPCNSGPAIWRLVWLWQFPARPACRAGNFLQLRRCLISAGAVAGRVCADRVFVGRNCCSVGCYRIGACCPGACRPGGCRGTSGAIAAAGRGRRREPKKSPQADARGDSLFRVSPDSDQIVFFDVLEITVGADLQFRGCGFVAYDDPVGVYLHGRDRADVRVRAFHTLLQGTGFLMPRRGSIPVSHRARWLRLPTWPAWAPCSRRCRRSASSRPACRRSAS